MSFQPKTLNRGAVRTGMSSAVIIGLSLICVAVALAALATLP